MKAQNMHQLRVLGDKYQALYFLPLVSMLWHSAETPNPGTMPWSAHHWFLCFGTRLRHQTWPPWLGPPRLKKAKSNFFTNHNILHALKNEPLNIMILHTSRTMDGPRIKMVPVVSRIFDVSS